VALKSGAVLQKGPTKVRLGCVARILPSRTKSRAMNQATSQPITVAEAARRLSQALGQKPRTWVEKLRRFDERAGHYVELIGVVRYRAAGGTVDVVSLEEWIAQQQRIALDESRPKEKAAEPMAAGNYDKLRAFAESKGDKGTLRWIEKKVGAAA
jgi:hypothetical protein